MSDTPTHCQFCGSDEPDDCFDIQVRTERCYERQISALKARVAELEKINKNSCDDWAEDHTHLQKLCHEAGCTEYEVEGDSYGVPGIGDLADLLAKKLAAERETAARWREHYHYERDRAAELQKALEDERANSDRLAEACGRAREFVKSWGELNDEEWDIYRSAIQHADQALASHEALRKP